MPMLSHRLPSQAAARSRQILAYAVADTILSDSPPSTITWRHTQYWPLLQTLMAYHSARRGSTLHISNMWQLQCHCMSVHAHRCESPPLFWHAASPMGLVPGGASSLPFLYHMLGLSLRGTVSLRRHSGNVSRVFTACRLHYFAAAVPTACMHGHHGLCP